MNLKILATAVAVFLVASMPSTATADILEIRFSGTVAEGSNDMTNVFGFGTGNALDGKTATGVLRINLSTAPPGIMNKPNAGMNYFDADASQTTWEIPSFSWIESSLFIQGQAAPDLVLGNANSANADLSVVNDGGAADGWSTQDWATTVVYPEQGRSITYEDLLALQIYNADFLNGFDLNQQFTLSGAPINFAGVAEFRHTLMDSAIVDPYQILAQGFINVTLVTAKVMKGLPGSYDFNDDDNPDILWRNTATGENYIWYLGGLTVPGGGSLPMVTNQNWKIVGVGDFNNDFKRDILWRNMATGENWVWYLNGVTVPGGGALPTEPDQNWKVVGVADFNNDGRPDIFWRHEPTGYNYVWYLDGVTVLGGDHLPMVDDPGWKVVGVGDFNNDGNPDVLWRHQIFGYNYIWYLEGVTVIGGGGLPAEPNQNWRVVGVADFNGDGKVDILWRHLTTGENHIWYLDGLTVLDGGSLPTVTDQNWTIVPQIY